MRFRLLLLASCLAFAAPVAAAPVLTPPANVHVDVIQLESDPPGNVRQAPGGGRTLAPAMLYTPSSGANQFGPAIVMLDDGPGSQPLAHDQAARFTAERLAARGYTVISLYTGQERNFTTVPFGDVKWAVKSAIDYLEHGGYEDIALVGQGYGAAVVGDYLKSLPDTSLDNGPERRVKGAILVNPALEVKAYPQFGDTRGYDARLALAEKEVADKTGLYPAELEPGHNTGPNQADWIMQGIYATPAQGWLEYWSPKAQARNTALMRDLPVPTLVLAGQTSAMAPMSRAQALAGANEQVKSIQGAGDDLTSATERVTGQIAQWLAAHDLAPRPAVTIHTTDITTVGGKSLFALVYDPATGVDPKKPVLVLVSGRSADTLQSSTHWMGWRFAQKGYRVIAPNMRISGPTGIETETMAHTREDIGKWVDAASGMGAHAVVLAGHSNGGIWISDYVAGTHDKRVAGMIYFAPTVDAQSFQRRLVGDAQYEKDDAKAYAAIAAGHGIDTMMGLQTPVAFVELYGSKALTVHSDRVKEFDLPAMAVAGGKDPLMSDWFLSRFTANYRGHLDLKRYPDGTHGLRENKDHLADDVATWLGTTFP